MSISNKAVIVHLQVSQWTARKLDRKATQSVETAFSTVGKVGNYTKQLLPAARELDEVAKQVGAIREYLYKNTLPWFADGSRILSSKNYIDFTTGFRVKQSEFETAVNVFIAEYPALREKAKSQLGSLFVDSEYPQVERLKKLFSCEISFMPVPNVDDFRVEILDSEKTDFLNKMKETESVAMKDCWTRLYDVVAKAAEKLKKPDAIFRDSLIENINEMCGLLPKLNVTDDANLESMRQTVESMVATLNPEKMRYNLNDRHDAASKLQEITSKMSVFMGE